MHYKHHFLLALLIFFLAACGGKSTVIPSNNDTLVTFDLSFNSQAAFSTQGLPQTKDKVNANIAGEIKVFEGTTEILFDSNGNITTSNASPLLINTSTSTTSFTLSVPVGSNYTFKFLGYEVGDSAKKSLAYGVLTTTITSTTTTLAIPLYTLLDKERITLERRDGKSSDTIEANTLVEYYLTINASGRNDLFATMADFKAISYINSQGSIGFSSDVGAEYKVPLNILPPCGEVKTDIGVKIEGYVDTNGVISKETFNSPVRQVTIVYPDGTSPKACQSTTVDLDVLKPSIKTEIAADSSNTTIKITGFVGDLHSGVSHIEVLDGVRKLPNAVINIPQDHKGAGTFEFSWQWNPDNVKDVRTLRFVAYDKANNIGESEIVITAPTATKRIYVDNTKPEGNKGTSWQDAFKHLQDALAVARSSTDVKEIWVRGGTGAVYHPNIAENAANITDTSGNPTTSGRHATFYITEGIKVYGGFNGTEVALSQRPKAHDKPTIISGDIGGDDVNDDGNLISEAINHSLNGNSFLVVMIDGGAGQVNVSQETVLDTLIVTGGFKDPNYSKGAGIYCNGSGANNACSPLLNNLHVIGNYAQREGGGLFNNGSNRGQANPTIKNSTFTSNTSFSHGGAIMNDGQNRGTASPNFINTAFHKNYSGAGSAMFNDSTGSGVSNPFVYNAVFTENNAGRGVIFNDGHGGASSNLTLVNGLFFNNTTHPRPNTQYYCTAITNNGVAGGKANATLINVTIVDNLVPNGSAANNGAICNDGRGGEAHLTIHNSILWNNPGRVAGQIYSYAGQTTIAHTLIQGGVTNGIHNAGGSTTTDNGNNIDAAPQFTDAANRKYTLKPTSPAINAGNNAVLPANVTTDLAGNVRIQLDTVDMGAYESDKGSNN